MVFITNTNGGDDNLRKKKNKTEIEKEYLLFREEFKKREYEKIFNRMCTNTDNVTGRAFMAYKRCLDNIIHDYNDRLISFLSDTNYDLNLKNGKLPIKNYTDNDKFNAIVNYMENEKLEIDIFYCGYINKLNKENDFVIKEFPEKADENDKKLLNELAEIPLIDKTLNNGKFDVLFGSKEIVRFLIKNKVKKGAGLVFFNDYINYEVDRSTLVHYFNEIPKDTPK